MSRHILVVDDDMDTREIIRMRFEQAGYRVSLAQDGFEAVEFARDIRPDVIIMDVMMPRLNGYKASRLIKFDPKSEGIPIFMLSARTTQKDKKLGEEAGVRAYMVKPFDVERLFRLVEETR